MMILPTLLAFSSQGELEKLRQVKYFMINGNFLKARRYLSELELRANGATWEPIQKRYLAMIEILQERFDKADRILSKDFFNQRRFYDRVCPLKIIAKIAIGDGSQLGKEYDRCFLSRVDDEVGDLSWLDTLLKGRGLFNLARERDNVDRVSLWLKLALYLEAKKNVLDQLRYIPSHIYRYPRVRELVSLLHYRHGNKREALNLVKGVDLVNAHNIRANIAIENRKYHTAYRHVQSGLEKKRDSLNGIYRSIPLSWLTENLESGLTTLQLSFNLDRVTTMGRIFRAVLYTELGRHEKAIESLLLIPKKERKSYLHFVDELLSYNYFVLGQLKQALLSAYGSCARLDGVNCYLLTHLSRWDQWESAWKGMDNFKKTFATDSSNIDLDTLWESELSDRPFQDEKIFIEQAEVERLDALSSKDFD